MTQPESARPERCQRAVVRMRLSSAPVILVAAAGLALAVGLLLYQVDRGLWRTPWSPALATGPLFGTLGHWLPGFLHTLAFSLLTAAVREPAASPAYGACAAWWAVNVAFEVGQHPQVSTPLAGLLRDAFGPWWPAHRLADYLSHGTFDVGDIVAVTLGASAAAAVLWLVHRQGEIRHAH